MTVSEFITALFIVAVSITSIVALLAWIFVRIFLAKWERKQSETIVSQEPEKLLEIDDNAITIDGADRVFRQNLNQLHVIYDGTDIESMHRDELIAICKLTSERLRMCVRNYNKYGTLNPFYGKDLRSTIVNNK